jgi:hypothetical protein
MTLSRGLNSKSHGYDSDEDDWDDTVSVASSSASTLVDFERSNHGLQRMKERDVSNRQVSRCIKYGHRSGLEDDRVMFLYEDMVVIIAESDYNSISTIDSDEIIAAQIEVQSADPNAWGPKSKKVLVTVYKEDPAILGDLTPAEYQIWQQVMRCVYVKYEDGDKHDCEKSCRDAICDIFSQSGMSPDRISVLVNYRSPHWLTIKEEQIGFPSVYTPLMFACYICDAATITLLLNYGADPNITGNSNKKFTALHFLLSHNNSDKARISYCIEACFALLRGGRIDMNYMENGYSVLHRATWYSKNLEVVEALIRLGADLYLLNKFNETCVDVLQKTFDEATVTRLITIAESVKATTETQTSVDEMLLDLWQKYNQRVVNELWLKYEQADLGGDEY